MFKIFNVLILTILIFMLSACSAAPISKLKKRDISTLKMKAAVIGVKNDTKTDNKEWNDKRVGMGLKNLLSQLVYDSDYFTIIEDNADIQEKIREIAEESWTNQGKAINTKKIKSEIDYLIYGTVLSFGRPKEKVSLGLLSRNTNSVVIEVEVTIENIKTGNKLTAKEMGIASTSVETSIYKFRDDNIDFDKSNIGIATKEAVSNAVNKVIEKYEKTIKKKF